MLAHFPVRRLARRSILPLVALTLLALLPGYSATAQPASETQILDDRQTEFSDGTFQRTSLSAETNPLNPQPNPQDRPGTVQLAPIGFLKPWELSVERLPEPIAYPGVVVLGDRLYAITGSVGEGRSSAAYWASVDQITGSLKAHGLTNDPRVVDERWLNDALPAQAIVDDPECLPAAQTPVAARTRSAVTALSTGGNTGYIYVIGGSITNNCGADLTTPTVQIGAVNAAGKITWSQAGALPSPVVDGTGVETRKYGVEAAAAVVVQTSTNKSFLYLIGGQSNYSNFLGVQNEINSAVFYAEINPANGQIRHPTNGSTTDPWARTANVPVVDPTPVQDELPGLRFHSAVAAQSTINSGTTTISRDAIFVSGGYVSLNSEDLNPFVYRATIDPASGALTWTDKPNTNNDQVGLEGPGRRGPASVAYNNKLYIIGGSTSEAPSTAQSSVLTAIFDDNLDLQRFPNGEEYFIGSQNPEKVIASELSDANAAIMDAFPPPNDPDSALNSAWAFVAGGIGAGGAPVDTIYRGKIGGVDEAAASTRANEGWYYSGVFNVSIAQQRARVLAIRWSANIDRSRNPNADILVEFRKTVRADPSCPNESVFAATDQWFALDGDPNSPFFSQTSSATKPLNEVQLEQAFGTVDLNATCLQYRARFVQNGLNSNNQPNPPASSGEGDTPKLYSVNLEKVLSGNPDIRAVQFEPNVTAAGSMTSFNIDIQNLSLEGLASTLPANLSDDGSFFVNLCVAYAAPGQPAPVLQLPTLPQPNGQIPACSVAYYEVFKAQMLAGRVLQLKYQTAGSEFNNAQQGWRRNSDNQFVEDLRQLFAQPGTYQVGFLIDMWDFVPEGAAGEANNRGETTEAPAPIIRTFTITGPPTNVVSLPFIGN